MYCYLKKKRHFNLEFSIFTIQHAKWATFFATDLILIAFY